MSITIHPYEQADLADAVRIWNRVVEDGAAFPQLEFLTEETGHAFFSEQTFTGIAHDGEHVVGLYILHPNNIGRCGHLANASYAVDFDYRGRGVGEVLVSHSLAKAKDCGFRIMQFNAVVANNAPALHLYEKLGFVRLGVIPEGFLDKDGIYRDIVPQYKIL